MLKEIKLIAILTSLVLGSVVAPTPAQGFKPAKETTCWAGMTTATIWNKQYDVPAHACWNSDRSLSYIVDFRSHTKHFKAVDNVSVPFEARKVFFEFSSGVKDATWPDTSWNAKFSMGCDPWSPPEC